MKKKSSLPINKKLHDLLSSTMEQITSSKVIEIENISYDDVAT
jgi:hypothetical protein